jgi:arylsulfatase A-like enzyme
VLVTIDTLRRDHCSAYGYERDTTPTLRRVAAEGARFDLAYSPTATTGPTHSTIFTSLYPIAHGVVKNGVPLGAELRTLAEILGARGYQTAAFVGSFVLDAKFGYDQGFDLYDDDFAPETSTFRGRFWEGHPVPDGFDRRADETTRRAVQWLREGRDPDRRFFLFVHYFDPHAPYVPPPPYDSYFSGAGGRSALEKEIDAYDGEIAFADHELGRLLSALAESGLEDDTLLAITADHGEGLGQHGHMRHGLFLYEEAVRVPLLFRWPDHIPAGLVFQEPVEFVDLVPTILGLAGHSDSAAHLQGQTLAPVLRGERSLDSGRPVYLYRRLYETGKRVSGVLAKGQQFGIRRERWKYIEAPEEGRTELFDLESDPGELENLYAALPDRASQLAAELEGWRRSHARGEARRVEISEEDRLRLRQLGYVD